MDTTFLTDLLKRSGRRYLDDILTLIVAGFIISLLSALTLGVMAGPMMAALYRAMGRRFRDGRAPEIMDIFDFQHFLRYMLAFYALAILIGLGFLLFILPGLYLLTIWLYVLPLMVERDLTLGEAMGESKAIADRIGLVQQFAIALILALIGYALSSLAGTLGSLLFNPFVVVYVLTALHAVEPAPPEAQTELSEVQLEPAAGEPPADSGAGSAQSPEAGPREP